MPLWEKRMPEVVTRILQSDDIRQEEEGESLSSQSGGGSSYLQT
jgi:hypothetical protein